MEVENDEMTSNISIPHRRNHRLPDFDYSQPGAYFVTIVTQNRKTLFGQAVEGQMIVRHWEDGGGVVD